jgi:hypothetical protein
MAYFYESNQQHATIQVNLLFQVSSTCFGRCFRVSTGAFDFIYSIWQYSPLGRILLYSHPQSSTLTRSVTNLLTLLGSTRFESWPEHRPSC